VNPNVATLASVTYARFAVQVAQQYEFDIRDLGENFSTGYIPYGTTLPAPAEYPKTVYGTEVFELNAALRDRVSPILFSRIGMAIVSTDHPQAVLLSSKAHLNDSSAAISFRANYAQAPARQPPTVLGCDVATSDNWFTGTILGDAAANFTLLMTNNTGRYCTTAQEDNATLEAMLRAAVAKKLDFARIIVMRTASDFDRPHEGESAYQHMFFSNQGGFPPALANIYIAGIEVVRNVIEKWEGLYVHGVVPNNYVGDIFGSLGGTPDFGPWPFFGTT
jgi:purine nucleoside permease